MRSERSEFDAAALLPGLVDVGLGRFAVSGVADAVELGVLLVVAGDDGEQLEHLVPVPLRG